LLLFVDYHKSLKGDKSKTSPPWSRSRTVQRLVTYNPSSAHPILSQSTSLSSYQSSSLPPGIHKFREYSALALAALLSAVLLLIIFSIIPCKRTVTRHRSGHRQSNVRRESQQTNTSLVFECASDDVSSKIYCNGCHGDNIPVNNNVETWIDNYGCKNIYCSIK